MKRLAALRASSSSVTVMTTCSARALTSGNLSRKTSTSTSVAANTTVPILKVRDDADASRPACDRSNSDKALEATLPPALQERMLMRSAIVCSDSRAINACSETLEARARLTSVPAR